MESCALRFKGQAEGTWGNKVSHLSHFICFCEYYGVQDFPLQLGTLLRFIAILARTSLAFGTANNILGSVRYFTSFLDPSSVNLFSSILVSAEIKGLKAQLSRPVRQKLPFTVAHLIKFHSLINIDNVRHLAAWCAMLLAFFGCFRLSNLVPLSKNKFDPSKQLRISDVKFSGDLVLIFYKWSKTNQNSSKVTWIPVHCVGDNRFNLKSHFVSLFTKVNAPLDSPLFSYGPNAFLSRASLVKILDNVVCEAGLSPADYSWHSFRRGAAVFAFELGLPDSAVQLLGDWSSGAFKNYLEFSFLRKVSVSQKLAKSFEKQINFIYKN